MSAFLLDHDHIDYLVTAANVYRCIDGEFGQVDDDAIGCYLLHENAVSVAFRYNEPVEDTLDYRHTPVPWNLVTPVQTLKAIQCWRYQTCEHPEHAKSPAWYFIDRLESEARSRLPGYDAAAWCWERP